MSRKRTRTMTLTALAVGVVLLASCATRPATSIPAGGADTTMATRAIQAIGGQDLALIQPLTDVHFDTGRAEIRPEDATLLEGDVKWLQAHPDTRARIEGHADERASVAYNHALGARRAAAVGDFLVARGIRAERLTVVSFGKERPLCTDRSAACMARNRRVHVSVGPAAAVGARERDRDVPDHRGG